MVNGMAMSSGGAGGSGNTDSLLAEIAQTYQIPEQFLRGPTDFSSTQVEAQVTEFYSSVQKQQNIWYRRWVRRTPRRLRHLLHQARTKSRRSRGWRRHIRREKAKARR